MHARLWLQAVDYSQSVYHAAEIKNCGSSMRVRMGCRVRRAGDNEAV